MIFNKSLSYLVATMLARRTLSITDGELDGEGHPHVGLIAVLDEKGSYLWRCTGTLISDKVFLTAGHCVEPPAASAQIFFDADVESRNPYKGDVASNSIHIHPNYDPNAFYLHDLGIVTLRAAVTRDYYGELPTIGLLDDLVSEYHKSGISFTVVGYGYQYSNPHFEEADKVRYVSYPELIQSNTPGKYVGDHSILTTNNPNTGGTCFADSGAPLFLEDTNVIVGVNSYRLNPKSCRGADGSYRIDTVDALEFINSFI